MQTCEKPLLKKYLDELRFVWSESVLSKDPLRVSQIRHLLESPLRTAHPFAEVLTALLAQKIGESHPPLKEDIGTLSMGELCQMAILREIASKNGQSLGKKILPWVSFPSLFCPERVYDVQETKNAISLLLQAFGKESRSSSSESSYFRALAQELPKMQEGENVACFTMVHSLDLGEEIQNAFVVLGEKVPLGAMRKGGIEVPSFGPQVHPLNDPNLFGIHRTIEDSRWAAVSAKHEVWFEYFLHSSQKGLEIRFLGMSPECPISFVFYVKADLARVDGETYLPKSLRRYCGKSKKVTFEMGTDRFSIENTAPCKMDIIPLAGGGCFWDADFLLGFEIPLHDGRAVFHFC